jgi:hypothetical protein
MIDFTPSTADDLEQLGEWIAADKLSRPSTPSWWFTGQGLLTFCLQDSIGPVCYVRLEREDQMTRLHTLFGPPEEVHKIRLVKAMLKAIPVVIEYSKSTGASGVVFDSKSESLISFMKRQGFISLDKGDDFVLYFKVENTVQ